MWPPLPKTNQSLSWQTSRSYAPSENVFCFLRSGKHFPPFPCAITFSNPLCYCHDYHYCRHCHCTTTTIDIEANGVLPSMNHGRRWEGAAPGSDATQRSCPCVGAASELFFFFHWFAPTRLRFASSRADSVRIGSYRLVTETAEIGQNRPWIMLEQPKSALNEAQTS